MIPLSCKTDVSVCIQSSNYPVEDFDLPKVTVSYDTLEVSTSESHILKTFKFDKIYNQNFQDALESLCISVNEDIITGVNRILFSCNLADNNATSIANMNNLSSTILNCLCTTVNNQKNAEASLHVSCIETNDKGIFDLMHSGGIRDLKLFKIPNQNTEIKNLSEKPITAENEIDEILSAIFPKNKACNYTDCCHTVLSSVVIVKNKNSDGFECIKVGRFTLVDLASCVHFLKDVINFIHSRRESFYSTATDISQILNGKKDGKECCLNSIFKHSTSNAKISVILVLPSVLFDQKRSLHAIEIVSEIQNLTVKPQINEKLILRESLKDYAEEIKVLEKDLLIFKNSNGISISEQKYRSLKNKCVLTEEQLKELSRERKKLSDSVSSKNEILTRLQQEIMLMDIKIQDEGQKLKATKLALEETENKRIALDLEKMKKVDACLSLKTSLNSSVSCVKNQNVHLLKLKHQVEISMLNAKLLNEDITNYTKIVVLEQIKLKDNISSLLLYLKDALLNSSTQQHNFLVKANDFYQNFEEMFSQWKQQSTNFIYDFHNFMEENTCNCYSIRKNLYLEFMSLNSEQDKVIDIIMDCKNERKDMISCCSNNIQMSVEISIKLLKEILHLLEIVRAKMKEQLKTLESSIYSCSKDHKHFLNSIYSSLQSMHQYFEEQIVFSLQIKSKADDYHQELKVQQAYLLETKKICERSSELLKQCNEEHFNLMEVLGQQCMFNIDELHLILTDQIGTIDSSCNQLFDIFNDINNNIENLSEESKKKIYEHESNMKDSLKIQSEKVTKCFKTAYLMTENIAEFLNEGLHNTRNSALSIIEHKIMKDANLIVSQLNNNIILYVSVHNNILKKSEDVFQQLPDIIKKRIENPEESIVFNHEEVLSSTPSSHFEKPKSIINERMKLLNKLKGVATAQMNSRIKSNSSLDWDFKLNESFKSLSTIRREAKVEINPNRSYIQRKVTK
ncbi:uncharacterized protein NPIL_189062 [Nephila pilipes]|uniref:Uncharacterized protein n=1 Tax=Nephila pilipes TaxID=299642 RepID=A0A8X6MM92_NEPPI|nr:uncharacterized protein NPIL_189062 [Nephila pilipes]